MKLLRAAFLSHRLLPALQLGGLQSHDHVIKNPRGASAAMSKGKKKDAALPFSNFVLCFFFFFFFSPSKERKHVAVGSRSEFLHFCCSLCVKYIYKGC